MRRAILSLLLVCLIGAPSYADVLLKRYENSEVYRVNKHTKKLVVGGDIENVLPFDGSSNAYVPSSLVYSEGEDIAGGKFLGKGGRGYFIKLDQGFVRTYPVRGDKTKYVEIGSTTPIVLSVNQINNKTLEVYKDKAKTRWSLFMTPKGFKPYITLKPGYSGGNTFELTFKLNNLTRSGASILDGGTKVLRLHNAFLTDANGINRAVSESFNGDVVTLTADLTYPVVIDPTLGSTTNPTKDTYLENAPATTGYGQEATIKFNGYAPNTLARPLLLWDISVIPIGSIIISSDMELNVFAAVGGAVGKTYSIYRCTRTDWEDAGTATIDAEANWNNYKDPNVAWTTPGGDFTITNAATGLTYPGGAGFLSQSIIELTQDAVDNHSGNLSLLQFYDDETSTANSSVSYRSLEYGVAAERPKLTIVYEVDGSPSTHLGYRFMEFF
jgi:hypothetical protein